MWRSLLVCFVLILPFVQSQPWDIADLAESIGCTMFSGLLQGTGFEYELGDDKSGPFTVYVPTNDAFEAIPKSVIAKLNRDENWELMHELVGFHITRGNLSFHNWTNDLLIPTSVEGSDIRLNLYKNSSGAISEMTACGATLVKADQVATNGIIQVIDRVMYRHPTVSIPTYVQESTNLSSLAMLIKVGDFFKSISEQNLTLFAPSNEAFESSNNQTFFINLLASNQSTITEFLGNHLINSTLYSRGLFWSIGGTIQTVSGKTLQIQQNSSGSFQVNGIQIQETDIPVNNGVIHLIDSYID